MSQTAYATPPGTAPAPPAPEGRNTRALLIGGIAAAVVVAGGGWYFLNSGSSAEEASAPVVAAPARPGAPAAKPSAPAAPAPAVVPFSLAVRDPFAALQKEATSGGTGTAATPAKAAAKPAAPAKPVAPAVKSVTLGLKSVTPAGDGATVTVDGKPYVVAVGATFASSFKLYGVFGTKCAGVLYGDTNVALCVGDTKSVP